MTKKLFNQILEEIITEYFDEEFTGGLWEVIEYIKVKYEKEINTLEG